MGKRGLQWAAATTAVLGTAMIPLSMLAWIFWPLVGSVIAAPLVYGSAKARAGLQVGTGGYVAACWGLATSTVWVLVSGLAVAGWFIRSLRADWLFPSPGTFFVVLAGSTFALFIGLALPLRRRRQPPA